MLNGPIAGGTMLQRSLIIATLVLLATPAAAGWTLPCLFSGCSITFVSPEYAAKPVQKLDPEKALAEVNAFRTKYGRDSGRPDARLSQAAAMQSKDQAGRSSIGHYGCGRIEPMQRAERAGFHAKLASENVAAGQKSFSDAMRSWEGSSGHRENLLRPEVTAIGVAMAKNEDGRAYWTLLCSAPSDLRVGAASNVGDERFHIAFVRLKNLRVGFALGENRAAPVDRDIDDPPCLSLRPHPPDPCLIVLSRYRDPACGKQVAINRRSRSDERHRRASLHSVKVLANNLVLERCKEFFAVLLAGAGPGFAENIFAHRWDIEGPGEQLPALFASILVRA